MRKLLLSGLLLAANFSLQAAPERPNVLFIAVDDLKPVLGCYGNPIVKTPNMDRLAARGVLFERAYVNQAVCSPSRNTLMLGLRPQTLGIYDLPTHFRDVYPDSVTMGQSFMKNGYRAEAVGKIFHAGKGNHNDELSWSVPHWTPKSDTYSNPANAAPSKGKKGAPTEAEDVADITYQDGKTAEEAINRLKKAKQDPAQPFLLMVGFSKPHLPFVSPKKYWDLYKPSDFALPERRTAPDDAPSYARTSSKEVMGYVGVPQELPLPDDLGLKLIHGYYAAVSYTDAQIGKVLDALDAEGLSKNTIIVLWGDHGWHLGDHGMWCKHTNYEQATRIPLLFAGPGVALDKKSQSLAETVDIYPTLMQMTGQQVPSGLEGMSLVPVLADPSKPTKDHVLSVYPRSKRIGRAVRTERYRLVEWKVPGEAPETAELELYDYEADPQETKNLATEKLEVVKDLRAMLAKYPEAKPQVPNPAAKDAAPEKKKKKSEDDGE